MVAFTLMEPAHTTPAQPDPDLTLQKSYIGDTTPYRQFRRLPIARDVSLKSLIDQIDLLFADYIESRLDWKEAKIWLDALERNPLSSIIKRHLSKITDPILIQTIGAGFDFEDRAPLSSSSLADTLLVLGDVATIATGDLREVVHVSGDGHSPVEREVKRLLCLESHPESPHTIEDFFKFLREQYFFSREKSTEEIQASYNAALYMEFEQTTDILIRIVASMADREKENSDEIKIVQSIINIRRALQSDDERQGFLDKIEDFLPESELPSISHLNAFIEHFYPSMKEENLDNCILRFAWVGSKINVINRENFYFSRQSDRDPIDDWDKFGEDGAFISDDNGHSSSILVGGRRDVSVFDPEGHKVFWGDIHLESIKGISGPFYVLSQRDSYLDVPEEFVIHESESRDTYRERTLKMPGLPRTRESGQKEYIKPNREASRIDIGYMKIKALGVIEDGNFKPNTL